jgi:protein-L-isoaspartate(D-aspartate) O-methyltransferase
MELCGFVPIIGQHGERTTELAHGTVRLHHDQDQPIDPDQLAEVFSTPLTELWSQARVGSEETFDGIWLRATASDDAVCRIEVTNNTGRRSTASRHPQPQSRPRVRQLSRLLDRRTRQRRSRTTVTTWRRRLRTRRDLPGAEPDRPGHRMEHRPRRGTAHDHPSGRHPDSELPKGHVIDKTDSRIVLSCTDTNS